MCDNRRRSPIPACPCTALRSGSPRKYRPQLPISRSSWHGENRPPGTYGVCEVRCVLPNRPAGLSAGSFLLGLPVRRATSGQSRVDHPRLTSTAELCADVGWAVCAGNLKTADRSECDSILSNLRPRRRESALFRQSPPSYCGDFCKPPTTRGADKSLHRRSDSLADAEPLAHQRSFIQWSY
jgi:hypothetical protein